MMKNMACRTLRSAFSVSTIIIQAIRKKSSVARLRLQPFGACMGVNIAIHLSQCFFIPRSLHLIIFCGSIPVPKNQTPPQVLLGKALSYALSRWSKLICYLENGHITPDNNAAENAMRPFVVGRKNWLFTGIPSGADAAATIYSLIETAKACRIEPYQYPRFQFENLPCAHTEAQHAALLPQNADSEILASL
ncbi:hypothetical protein SBDP1_350002 [Syntrophobacter sp. SbD1]|nr:hypothetical protein SBDP1_350002 [Syntrophobacter sp. SbD1]